MNTHSQEYYKNKYIFIKKIGVGNYTDVYQVQNKLNKELRALKIIKLIDYKLDLEGDIFSKEELNKELNDFIKSLRNEIENMKICGENNDNSIKYYESFETKEEFVIVMELADEDLSKFRRTIPSS